VNTVVNRCFGLYMVELPSSIPLQDTQMEGARERSWIHILLKRSAFSPPSLCSCCYHRQLHLLQIDIQCWMNLNSERGSHRYRGSLREEEVEGRRRRGAQTERTGARRGPHPCWSIDHILVYTFWATPMLFLPPFLFCVKCLLFRLSGL
jgi:hypothetical protein